MTRAKIEQIVAVTKESNGSGVAVVALDEYGQVWATFTNNLPSGESGWNEWHKLPLLPDGSGDPAAMFK